MSFRRQGFRGISRLRGWGGRRLRLCLLTAGRLRRGCRNLRFVSHGLGEFLSNFLVSEVLYGCLGIRPCQLCGTVESHFLAVDIQRPQFMFLDVFCHAIIVGGVVMASFPAEFAHPLWYGGIESLLAPTAEVCGHNVLLLIVAAMGATENVVFIGDYLAGNILLMMLLFLFGGQFGDGCQGIRIGALGGIIKGHLLLADGIIGQMIFPDVFSYTIIVSGLTVAVLPFHLGHPRRNSL